MKINKKTTKGITRRDVLKVSGLGLVFGGLAMTGTTASKAIGASSSYPPRLASQIRILISPD